MSVAAFYEGKARGETDEKYRVLGLAQLADFHAASSVAEAWNLTCAGAPKGRRNGQNGLFSSRFFTWLANSIGLARCRVAAKRFSLSRDAAAERVLTLAARLDGPPLRLERQKE